MVIIVITENSSLKEEMLDSCLCKQVQICAFAS